MLAVVPRARDACSCTSRGARTAAVATEVQVSVTLRPTLASHPSFSPTPSQGNRTCSARPCAPLVNSHLQVASWPSLSFLLFTSFFPSCLLPPFPLLLLLSLPRDLFCIYVGHLSVSRWLPHALYFSFAASHWLSSH